MLTIFSTLKPRSVPFADNVQRNAIQSWMALDLPCEILLLGNDEGTAEIAAEYGLRHEPNITRIGDSPPLVKDLFTKGQELARFSLVMYINSDVILLSDFPLTLKRIIEERKNNAKNFLIIGQRIDLKHTERLDFQNPHWEPLLRVKARRQGSTHNAWAMDYFIFRKDNWLEETPAFSVGLKYYDNWLLYHALTTGMDVINATNGIMAIQQEYEYRSSYAYQFRINSAPLARHQRALLREEYMLFNIDSSNLTYTPSGLRRRSAKLWLKKIILHHGGPVLYPRYRALFSLIRKIAKPLIQARREPVTRARLKRIIFETGEIAYPRFKIFFQALRPLYRVLRCLLPNFKK